MASTLAGIATLNETCRNKLINHSNHSKAIKNHKLKEKKLNPLTKLDTWHFN